MTPKDNDDDEELSVVAAIEPISTTFSYDSSNEDNLAMQPSPSSSTPKGFMAVLAGAAKQLATSIRGPTSFDAPSTVDNGDAMEIGELVPLSSEHSGMDVIEFPAADLDSSMSRPETSNIALSLETLDPTIDNNSSPKYVIDNGEEILVWDEGLGDAPLAKKQVVKEVKINDKTMIQIGLGDELEKCLRSLQKRMTTAISVHKNSGDHDDDCKSIYRKLCNAAVNAYHSLVHFGSLIDLSSQIDMNGEETIDEKRRARLLKYGRNLWIEIRNNPDFFNDSIPHEEIQETDSNLVKVRKDRVIANGYLRSIAARLVFLNYIDSRCSPGHPPKLCKLLSGNDNMSVSPSPQELEFGLKLFSRAGRTILEHNRSDVRASYDLLSLAIYCFDSISNMANDGNGKAALGLKEIFDEAFDAFSLLPNAASLFGEKRARLEAEELKDTTWQLLVIQSLVRAESFVDWHFNLSTSTVHQCFLPSLARLCYKHGSHFLKLQEYDNAGKALQIALKSTNTCLARIKQELKIIQSQKLKMKQMLRNLEAELVVVSIEAFYLLNIAYSACGEKDKALVCLDRIEEYMKEQQDIDLELHSNIMSTLNSGEDQLFVENRDYLALGGSKTHFDKDKEDIQNRVQNALEDAISRHCAEKATLAFSRIMTFHKLPCKSANDELMIDRAIGKMVDLSLDTFSNQTMSRYSETNGHSKVFNLTLHAIRLVYVRRIIAKISGEANETEWQADNYRLLLDKLPKSHVGRPFVIIDKLNAMLAVKYQGQERKFDIAAIKKFDAQALETAEKLMEAINSFLEETSESHDEDSTSIIPSASQSFFDDMFEQAKIHLSRALSLHHASDDHELCAQWSDILQRLLLIERKSSLSLNDSSVLLGQVMTIKAYALSMSGDLESGRQTARDAWERVKTIDSMVTLFHCSLRHDVANRSGDTTLEFEAALNELLSQTSDSVTDDIIAAFPRLSNSCAENEGSDLILLRVQERWIDLILNSRLFECLIEGGYVQDVPELTLFDVFRAYLSNFEYIISSHKDLCESNSTFEALERIIDGVLKLLIQLRESRKQDESGMKKRRKNTGSAETKTNASEKTFTLIWEDCAVNQIFGNRDDCVWIVEQLWNIGNQLMSVSFDTSRVGDLRSVAANIFAASHDFCLMSDEEVGQSLSKGYLDFDVKFDPTKTVLPSFDRTNNGPFCDISSEFSAQCLLVSVATAADYASDCMMKNKNGACALPNDVQILLGRSLHRLAQAQDEMQLNCEDKHRCNEVNKMIVLLALRCLLGVGDDLLAMKSLNSNGLHAALDQIHLDELSAASTSNETRCRSDTFVSLKSINLMADLADERNMHQTSMCLQRLCSRRLAQSGHFVLDYGDYKVSLWEIQRKAILSSSYADDILDVYDEVDELIKKHQNEDMTQTNRSFYSKSQLTWFATDANNRAVEHDLLGDDETAARLFLITLNLLPLCGKDMQCHTKATNAAYQQITSKLNERGDSLVSLWSLANEYK